MHGPKHMKLYQLHSSRKLRYIFVKILKAKWLSLKPRDNEEFLSKVQGMKNVHKLASTIHSPKWQLPLLDVCLYCWLLELLDRQIDYFEYFILIPYHW